MNLACFLYLCGHVSYKVEKFPNRNFDLGIRNSKERKNNPLSVYNLQFNQDLLLRVTNLTRPDSHKLNVKV